MAVRALPEQLGAAIAAANADVRIHVEDGVPGELDVLLHKISFEVESREDMPDALMQCQRMRIVYKSVEQQFECAGRVVSRFQVPRQRQTSSPILWIVADQTP